MTRLRSHLGTAFRVFATGVVPLLVASPAAAETCVAVETQRTIASDASPGDKHGYALAVNGSAALVGSYLDDDDGSESGSAHVYRHLGGSWVREAKLVASDARTGDRFGGYLALSGDVAAIGAYFAGDAGPDSGSAYVFRRDSDGWFEEAKLTAPDAEAGDLFGSDLAIEGDTLVITARGDDDGAPDAGAVYFYAYDGGTWTLASKQHVTQPDAGALFGRSADMDGSTVVIGAYLTDAGASDGGAAYVFTDDGGGWTETATLTPRTALTDAHFGYAVFVDEDLIVVGAPGATDAGPSTGAAYVFRRNGAAWIEEARLTAGDPQMDAYFGAAVSVAGGVVAVGAKGADDDTGATYVFEHDGDAWGHRAKITGAATPDGAAFGQSVYVYGDALLVGAFHDDTLGAFAGAASIFRREASDWVEEARLSASDVVAQDRYGGDVAVDTDVLAAGAPYDDDYAIDAGSVFVRRFKSGAGWVEDARLFAPSPAAGDALGASVALDGVSLLAGSPGAPVGGRVIAWRHDGNRWRTDGVLSAFDAASGDAFGTALDVVGIRAVCGAPGHDAGRGAVYLFERSEPDGWTSIEQLTMPGATASAMAGDAVAIAGNVVVVGAPGHADDTGAAAVFRHDGEAWTFDAFLEVDPAWIGGRFGAAVAGAPDRIAISAPDIADGVVRLYRFNGAAWVIDATLDAPSGFAGRFGSALALSGDLLLVGAAGHAPAGTACAYRFDGRQWSHVLELNPSDAATATGTGFEFGAALALHGSTAVVGAPAHDLVGPETGAVYVYAGLLDCDGNDAPDLCDIASGAAADCDGDGTPDDCQIGADPSLDLDGSGVLDVCEASGDLDGDGLVGFADLILLLSQWGPCSPPCPADLNGDGDVGFADLIAFLSRWPSSS